MIFKGGILGGVQNFQGNIAVKFVIINGQVLKISWKS